MTESEIIVSGVTPLELRELEEKLGASSVKVLGNTDASFREPVTAAIAAVALSSLALKTITIIATRPRGGTKSSITIKTKDGEYTYSREVQPSGAPQPRQIEEIGKSLAEIIVRDINLLHYWRPFRT